MKISKLYALFLLPILFSAKSEAFTLLASSITAGWDAQELAFDVNETSCTSLGITASQLYGAIDAAIELWNKAPTTSIKFKRGGLVTSTSSTNPPTIYCTTTLPGGADPDFVIGVGTVAQTTGGRPSSGSLALNGDNARNAYFGSLNATQAAIVLAHEMGHVLGLGHSEKAYALMYYNISAKTNLNLSQDDVDGLTWLNPRDEPSGEFMGCGTISDINRRLPPPGGSAGLIFNWSLVMLLAFVASRFKRLFR